MNHPSFTLHLPDWLEKLASHANPSFPTAEERMNFVIELSRRILFSASIHISPMSNLNHNYSGFLVLDLVEDSIIATAQTVHTMA